MRLIFATNRDLEAMVKDGKFREDLYYRIHVVEVALPPLRDRREDVPQLVDHFLGRFAARYKRDKGSVARDGMRRLMEYEWPGNVRQLEHVLLNAWVLGERAELGQYDFDLPDGLRTGGPPPPLEEPVYEQVSELPPRSPARAEPPSGPSTPQRRRAVSEHHESEREVIIRALKDCNWNRVKAAELSGIPRRTFYRRLKQYGIQ